MNASGARVPGMSRLAWARVGWVVTVGLGIGLYIVGIPIHFAQWETLCSGASCGIGQITPEQAQQLPQVGLSLATWAFFLSLAWLIPLAMALVVAAVIFRVKPDDPMALFASFVLVVSQLGSALDYQSTSALLQFLTLVYSVLGNIVVILFLFVFPDGRFVPRWTRWLALLTIASALLAFFLENADTASNIVTVGEVIGALVQIYRYLRVSNPVQRQQTKWVVFGTAVSLLALAAIGIIFPTTEATQTLSPLVGILLFLCATICLALVPLSIGIAILRSHLWDIDILIRRTLVYAALTAMLAGIYFASVLVFQEAFRALTGQTSDLAIVASTLVISALFAPLRRGIQSIIDRRLYRRKYDASIVLSNFGTIVRDQVDLNQLRVELMAAVNDTMQPVHASLWLKDNKPNALGHREGGIYE